MISADHGTANSTIATLLNSFRRTEKSRLRHRSSNPAGGSSSVANRTLPRDSQLLLIGRSLRGDFRHRNKEGWRTTSSRIDNHAISSDVYRDTFQMSKPNRGNQRPALALAAVIICAIVAIGGIAVLIRDHLNAWRSASAPGTSTVSQTPVVALTNVLTNTTPSEPDLPPLPEDPSALVNIGNDLVKRGRVTEAIHVYQEALKKTPDDEEVHFNLGFAYSRLGKTNEAIAAYEQALQRLPDYAEAHNNLGNILVAQGKYPEAIQHFEAALKSSPEDSSAMNNLGRVLAMQNKTREAIPHFQDAIRISTNYIEAHFNLANSWLSLGSNDLAESEFQEVLRINPQAGPAIETAKRRIANRKAAENKP